MLPLVMEEEMKTDEYGERIKKSKESIVDMLMKLHDDNNVWSVIPVTGKPGTGKTTLIQHLYHDKSVCEHFAVRHLVFMSDVHHGGGPSKLLDQVFKHKTNDAEILNKFRSLVDGERYLLILDGVANKDQVKGLHGLLRNVGKGSKVIITAYDKSVLGSSLPLAIDDPYILESPSIDESWAMFQSIAFSGDGAKSDPKYEKIGKEICNKYASIPRLLNNVAILLRNSEDWEHMSKTVKSASGSSILSKVDLRSFEELTSEISECLVYCSMFPVSHGYRFSKEELLHLWDAQEYLQSDETKHELSGDECFNELQKLWYLFEATEQDSYGCNTAISYKTYNMDCAVNVFLRSKRKPNFCYGDDEPEDKANILHLSFPVERGELKAPSWLKEAKQLKSLLLFPCTTATVGEFTEMDGVLSVLRQLKALDLAGVNCEKLPDSLGGLTELRYLRLGVYSEILPKTITKLLKLQTLDLRPSNVMVLPQEFHRLERLKHLYTGDRLVDLPPNFKKLTSLQTLDAFIVGENNSVAALSQLNCLVGKLKIPYKKACTNSSETGETVLNDTYLTELSLIWSFSNTPTKCLNPPPSLKSLELHGWKEKQFPESLVQAFPSLSNLVSLHITAWKSCDDFPSLSALPNLTTLELWDLKEFKYMKSSTPPMTQIFPSLNYLMLANLPNLERWFDESKEDQIIFPRLVEFRVCDCPKLMSMPEMPVLELLEMCCINEELLTIIRKQSLKLKPVRSSSSSTAASSSHHRERASSKTSKNVPSRQRLNIRANKA